MLVLLAGLNIRFTIITLSDTQDEHHMIAAQNVTKNYGTQTALAPTTLDFAEGSTTVLIGPSGCGKSTLLRILVDLIEPDSGSVVIDGQALTPQNVERRRQEIGYVTQDGGLFPHLTARENVQLLAHYLCRPAQQTDDKISELCDLVQIPRESLDRYPSELSGGQRQRVSLMRALMLDPKVLLLDEPLGALDPITRGELQMELKAIFKRLNKTVVLVTHDMGEAAYFGDEIILMREGKIIQRGTLDALLNQPTESYVTTFIRAQRSPLPQMPEDA
jgi:osmoprotectant transport system ATP-binding protein